MPTIDLRPARLDLKVRPGDTHTVVLTWPESVEDRTFEADIDGEELTVGIDDAVVTVTIPDEITEVLGSGAMWQLREPSVDQSLITGHVLASLNGAITSRSASVVLEDTTVEVTVLGGSGGGGGVTSVDGQTGDVDLSGTYVQGTGSTTGAVTLVPSTNATVPLTLKGAASQTGDILRARTSADVDVFRLAPTGSLTLGNQADLAVGNHVSLRYASGKASAAWRRSVESYAFESGGYTDRVAWDGYNRLVGAGKEDAAEPILFVQFESKFRHSPATPFGSEYHLNFGRPTDSFVYNRPINVFMEHVTGNTQVNFAGSLGVTASGDNVNTFSVPDGGNGPIEFLRATYPKVTLPASGLPPYVFLAVTNAGAGVVAIDNTGSAYFGGSGTGAARLSFTATGDASVLEIVQTDAPAQTWQIGPRSGTGGDLVWFDYTAGVTPLRIKKSTGLVGIGASVNPTGAMLHIATADGSGLAGVKVTATDPNRSLLLGVNENPGVIEARYSTGADVDGLTLYSVGVSGISGTTRVALNLWRYWTGSGTDKRGGRISGQWPGQPLGNSAGALSFEVSKDDATLLEILKLDGSNSRATVTGTILASDDVEVTTIGKGWVFKSPDGTRWRLTLDNGGRLVTAAL